MYQYNMKAYLLHPQMSEEPCRQTHWPVSPRPTPLRAVWAYQGPGSPGWASGGGPPPGGWGGSAGRGSSGNMIIIDTVENIFYWPYCLWFEFLCLCSESDQSGPIRSQAHTGDLGSGDWGGRHQSGAVDHGHEGEEYLRHNMELNMWQQVVFWLSTSHGETISSGARQQFRKVS